MTALVNVDLYASVGGGELNHIGTVAVPVRSSKSGDQGLVIDLSTQFKLIKGQMDRFRPGQDDE